MTLQELARVAEVLGATVIPDEVDGPEFVFDSESFERFTDAVFRKGVEHGLDLAQRIVDNVKAEGAA
jgi:hypothetical protein